MKNLIIFFTTFFAFINIAQSSSGAKEVRLIFFGSSTIDYQIINVNNLTNFSTISTIYFDANIRTYLYIHGCTEGPNSVSAQTVIQAALTQKPNMNVVVLDWSDWSLVATLAGCPFAINTVTHNAINIFDFMRNFNFNPSNLHIVGFSFGAHLGGNLGRYFKKIGFLVPRLTCLDIPYAIGLYDPFYISLLPFILPPPLYRITRSDADLVEIYHTNAGKIGDAKMRGHLEFWFNGGVHQPGCVLFDASIFISNCKNFY